MTVLNTIVAGNGGFDFRQCSFGLPTSLGHNVDEGTSCGFDQPTDLTEPDLISLLGELDEVGGSPVHPLPTGSPAIDAIPVEDCLDSEDMPLLTDQRSVEPPQGPACDIGAVEFAPEPNGTVLAVAALAALAALALRRKGLKIRPRRRS